MEDKQRSHVDFPRTAFTVVCRTKKAYLGYSRTVQIGKACCVADLVFTFMGGVPRHSNEDA